jgi:hypothetical protein
MKSDPARIDVGPRDKIVNHRLRDAFGLWRGIKFFFSQRSAMARTVYVDEGHAAPYVLSGAAVIAAK